MSLVRKLQQTYMLEPAGTHGVWSLDDYQFLPFYWGASQLIGMPHCVKMGGWLQDLADNPDDVDHPRIKPSSIHHIDLLEAMGDEYLYLSCIAFIHKVQHS
jgi:serine/threonine-protein phosphatase 2A activator